jgi:hypothetical protein
LIADGQTHEWIIGIVLGGLVILVAGLGWRKLIRDRPDLKPVLVWLIAIFLVWCAPYVFLMKVSEQEVYRLAVVTVLVAATGSWALLRSVGRRLAFFVIAVWCVWVFVGTYGSVQKSSLLRHNAFVTCSFLDDMEAVLGDVSETECVRVLVTPSRYPPRTYSILCVPDITLRAHAVLSLDTRLDRLDLEIEYLMSGEEPPETQLRAPRLKTLRVDIASASSELVLR